MPEDSRAEPMRPLADVWLRPRRVFRALAEAPVGGTDYLLAAAQGIVSWLALCRAQSLGLHSSVGEILGMAALAGPVGGILGVVLMSAVYRQIGLRTGGSATRAQIFHVLAYGGVPLVVLLLIWLVAAQVAGPVAFQREPPATLDELSSLVLGLRSVAHWALIGWSLLLQIMGFSEVFGLIMRRALGIWLIGQLLVLLAVLTLAVVLYGVTGAPAG